MTKCTCAFPCGGTESRCPSAPQNRKTERLYFHNLREANPNSPNYGKIVYVDLPQNVTPIKAPFEFENSEDRASGLQDKIIDKVTTWAAFAFVWVLKSKYVRKWL